MDANLVATQVPTGKAVVLLAKSAFAASPVEEMRMLSTIVEEMAVVDRVMFAFSEQGAPSLRDVLLKLRKPAIETVLVVPLMLPIEPSFGNWVRRSISRWQTDDSENWPDVFICPGLSGSKQLPDILLEVLVSDEATLVPPAAHKKPEGSVVPAQQNRVLVCQGGACNAAGALSIWGHLRNEQQRLDLRNIGGGTMTAMTSCLGPCSLAPVLQVFPSGTYYGGVDEEGVEQIIHDHLLGGRVVNRLAYVPNGKKQFLRDEE